MKKRIRRFDKVICREVGENGVLIDLRSGEYFTTGASGLFVWKLVNGGVPFEAILRRFAKKYRLKEEQAKKDVGRFMAVLRRRRLINRAA